MDWDDSPLQKWLEKRNMSSVKFQKMVGCSKYIIYKVKRGMPICKVFYDKIVELTDGEIVPCIEGQS